MANGEGIVVVVNDGAGSSGSSTIVDVLRERLPAAEVVEAGEGDDVAELLDRAAARATVALGAAGGDGTLSCAAALAHDRALPLLAVPAGTLNHFARDAGLASVDDAVDAVLRDETVGVDLATVGGETFLNTAALGAYTELVRRRERLEGTIGKWPAAAIALVAVLRRAEPIALSVDGVPRRLWIVFIGNGRYDPVDATPASRAALDDGLLDVRLVDGARPWARTRLVGALLTGRLGRCTVYEQRVATSVALRAGDGSGRMRIALDGEVVEVSADVVVTKRDRTLRVYASH